MYEKCNNKILSGINQAELNFGFVWTEVHLICYPRDIGVGTNIGRSVIMSKYESAVEPGGGGRRSSTVAVSLFGESLRIHELCYAKLYKFREKQKEGVFD